jgi:hypothetical protein
MKNTNENYTNNACVFNRVSIHIKVSGFIWTKWDRVVLPWTTWLTMLCMYCATRLLSFSDIYLEQKYCRCRFWGWFLNGIMVKSWQFDKINLKRASFSYKICQSLRDLLPQAVENKFLIGDFRDLEWKWRKQNLFCSVCRVVSIMFGSLQISHTFVHTHFEYSALGTFNLFPSSLRYIIFFFNSLIQLSELELLLKKVCFTMMYAVFGV